MKAQMQLGKMESLSPHSTAVFQLSFSVIQALLL